MSNFKLSRKDINKLTSFVDKCFSYDERSLKRERENNSFDFFGVNKETDTVVVVDCSKTTVYAAIKRNGQYIYKGFIGSFNELSNFKKMIRCLG